MRVQMVDPPAYTPPYDRALCAALARAGAEVELITTPFPYGPVPEPAGYEVSELFYPRAARLAAEARGRRPLRLAEHVPGMLRLRSRARGADLVHLQWLALPCDRPLRAPAAPAGAHRPRSAARGGPGAGGASGRCSRAWTR